MAGTKDPKGTIEPKELKTLNDKYIGGVKAIVIDRVVEIQRDEKGKETELVINPGLIFYLRKPDRGTIKFAMGKAVRSDGTIDSISGGEVIINKCWVGGCEDIKNQDIYWFRACMETNTYLNEITGFI